MAADDAVLFIDSNKYLDLYQTHQGKKLLDLMVEHKDYIFITKQIVAEVNRNAIGVAAAFLREVFQEMKLRTSSIPDHLSAPVKEGGKGIRELMKVIGEKIAEANHDMDALGIEIMSTIRQSTDEVTQKLAPIFAEALAPSDDEFQKARDRRELGNPPGKASDPLGDQLNWEQLLSHFKGKKRLWIISRDGDYGTAYERKLYLNRFLFEELRIVAPDSEVFLFQDTLEGIHHFVAQTGVEAKSTLTPEEVEEIEKEERSLPPITPSPTGPSGYGYGVSPNSLFAYPGPSGVVVSGVPAHYAYFAAGGFGKIAELGQAIGRDRENLASRFEAPLREAEKSAEKRRVVERSIEQGHRDIEEAIEPPWRRQRTVGMEGVPPEDSKQSVRSDQEQIRAKET